MSSFAVSQPSAVARPRAWIDALHRLVCRSFVRLLAWQEQARERQTLLSLDDRLLKDVGLSRADVEWLWRGPQEPGGRGHLTRIDFWRP